MPLRFKVKYQNAAFTLSDLPDDATLALLKEKIYGKTLVDVDWQSIRVGYPPKEIKGENHQTLQELDIQSGSVIVMSVVEPVVVPEVKECPPEGKECGEMKVPSSPTDSTYVSLKEMGFSKTQAARALELSGGDLTSAVDIAMSGAADSDAAMNEAKGAVAASGMPDGSRGPKFVRRVIDADNSCLFNAVGYVFERNRKAAPRLRTVIANTVLGDPGRWTEAVLGKPPSDYCQWIKNSENWGGEIELAILCHFFSAEIVVVDIQTLHCYKYGSEYNQRVFLLYDGVHYDALAEEAEGADSGAKPEETDTTIFDKSDESKIASAVDVAADLKEVDQLIDGLEEIEL